MNVIKEISDLFRNSFGKALALLMLLVVSHIALAVPTNQLVANVYSSSVATGGVTPVVGSWQNYSYSFQAPASATTISILQRNDCGVFLIDDVSVKDGSNNELLANGNFSGGVLSGTTIDTDGIPTSWSRGGLSGWTGSVSVTDYIETDFTTGASGASGAQGSPTKFQLRLSTTPYFAGVLQTIPTIANATYTLSFRLVYFDTTGYLCTVGSWGNNNAAALDNSETNNITQLLVYAGDPPPGYVGPPSALTSAATSVTSSGATLNANASDNGAATTVTFEYGTTSGSYTTTAVTPDSNGSISAGAGTKSIAKALTGLSGSTTYYYRVKATSSQGTIYGAEKSFTTSAPSYSVTYNGNGSDGGTAPTDGSSPYVSGSTVTVAGVGSLTKTGSAFTGWNTAANGSGTARAAASTFTISANTTLYAQWAATYTVTYNGNGSDGGTVPTDGSSPYISGATVTVAGVGSLTKTGYNFIGWNTAANGSGTARAAAGTFTISANATLYAQWAAAPSATTSAASSVAGTTANLNGSVDDKGASTTITFEYGTTSGAGGSYTNLGIAPASNGTLAAGSGATSVAKGLTGLAYNTTYYYRVKAVNSQGTTYGNEQSFTTSKQAQTITFNNPGAQNFGTTPTLSASATSTLAVSFSSSTTGFCTVSGTTLTPVAAGACTINADQAGDSTYAAATTVSQSFAINAVAPGAPSIGTATGGDTQATVTFTAPASTGGGTITGYTVTSNPGGLTGTGASSPITVTGLTNGVSYTFTVTATNGAGTSLASAASNAVTPLTGPAVTSVTVPANGTYGTGQNLDFTVNWDGSVTVDTTGGTPRIALVVGATTVYANYVSGSGTAATVFRYTVTAGRSDSDGITVGALSLNSGTIRSGGNLDATLTLNSVGSTTNVLVDAIAPTLPAANIVVNNQSDPHKLVLTFSKALDNTTLGSAANWTATNNGGTTTYSVASVGLSGGSIVTLTLAAVDVTSAVTTITNSDANAHLKITPPATLKDSRGNTYAAGLVTESGATHVLDSTAPTLATVSSSAPTSSGGTLTATASEKVKGYWIAVASAATAPTVAQVKAAANYGAVTVVTSGNGALPNGTAGTLTLSGLSASTAYDLYLVADDAAGNPTAAVETATLTTSAAVSNGGSGAPTTTVTLPTGGGTASPSAGQTVVVTNNGANGSTINLPTPTSGGTSVGATVTVTLPGTGNVAVSNNSSGTQLQVQNITLPGSSTPVSTVQVSNGSATLVASGAGQTLVTTGLSNGLTVTSGGSGTTATVTASGNSQSLVLTGNANLTLGSSLDTQRTTLTLNQGSNGSSSQANLNIGGQTLSVSSSGGNTQLQVVPSSTVSGQSTSAIVVTGGSANIVGQSGQVMNVVPSSSGCGSTSGGYFEARSNNAQSNILSVNQGSLALTGHIPQGVVAYHYTSSSCNSFALTTPLAGGVAKDVLIYQGEYIEVDKNGQPVRIIVRSKDGNSGAAGDPLSPPAIASLSVDTVIPRLDLTTGRLPTGQSIVQSIANMLKLGSSGWVFSSQDGQGAIRVSNSGSGGKVALLPVGQVLADAERQDGVQCVGNGLCQTAAGNLVTGFNAALDAPQDFIATLRQIDSSASVRLNADGNLQVTVFGRTYLAQAGWSVLPATGGNGFASSDGSLWFTAGSGKQALYPVLAKLDRLLTVLKKIDPSATAQGDHQGTLAAVVSGQSYHLLPEWELIATPASHASDDYWLDNGVLYLNFLDGTAQGIRTK
jgi:hypothetical protein